MNISISDLKLKKNLKVIEKLPPAELLQGEDNGITGDITVEMDLSMSGDDIRADGRVSFTLVMQCGRCLESYRLPVSEEITLRYKLSADGSVTEFDEFGSDTFIPEKNRATGDYFIPLEALMRETVLLAIPMKHLCREDCAGLCPSCGKNLNAGACGCAKENASNPFAKLNNLLDDRR